MHSIMNLVPLSFLLTSHLSQASPIAQGGAIASPCIFNNNGGISYTISEQSDVLGPAEQLAFSCTPTGGASMLLIRPRSKILFSCLLTHANADSIGCTVGRGSTYSVAVTVEVGAELNLNFDDIVGAGVSASVSVTTEDGTVDEASSECTGPWTCGLLLTPTLHEVKGKRSDTTGGCEPKTTVDDYVVRFPVKEGNTPKATFSACACKNKDHWADAGAPVPCPNDC